MTKFPMAYMVVDVAILYKEEVLLGQKIGEHKVWRFPGGYLEAGETLEQCAIREVKEETGCFVNNLQYIGSSPIDAERFRNSKDKMTSAFFVCKYINGDGFAKDDLHKTKWMPINEKTKAVINPEHAELYYLLTQYMKY